MNVSIIRRILKSRLFHAWHHKAKQPKDTAEPAAAEAEAKKPVAEKPKAKKAAAKSTAKKPAQEVSEAMELQEILINSFSGFRIGIIRMGLHCGFCFF